MNKGLHELFQKRFDAVPWDMVQHARDLYEEKENWDLFAETMFDAYTEYLERVSLNDGVNFADFMAFTNMAMENQHKEKAMIKINVCHLTVLEVAEWICVSKNWEEAIELDIFYICAECGAVYLILKTDDGLGFDCPDCGREKGLQSAFLSV